MNFLARLRYAAFMTVAAAMITGMIGSVLNFNVIELLLHPMFAAVLFAVTFVLAPWLERFIPFGRKRQ